MVSRADTIRKGRKYDQVLKGARDVFMRDGFDGASVDDIAREAAVSKATLYNYFPDKRILFLEICSEQCRRQADAAIGLEDIDLPARDVMLLGAEMFVTFMVSPFAINMHRLIVGEAERFPELARQFYQSGPATAHERIKQLLKIGVARGELKIEDLDVASDQFAGLCKSDLWVRLIFSETVEVTADEIQDTAKNAVDTFIARYGV